MAKRPIVALMIMVFVSFATHAFAQAEQSEPGKLLKHKIAVGRFTNETNYGKTLLRDEDLDPLGKQAADIMATYLTKTNKFLVFERPDLVKLEREQGMSGGAGNVIGVDTLILGSIVEFGRATDGQRGMFNQKKVQRAHAKVAVRLVDVRTGLVFYSATGDGEAINQSGTVLGLGSTANYDATLSDKAISAAVENMIEELLNSLAARQWRTDILQIDGSNVYIAGGAHQGLRVGDRLVVMRSGKMIKSAQSGFEITLPSQKVADLEVQSLFGESETNEGAVAQIVSGQIDGNPDGLYVAESK